MKKVCFIIDDMGPGGAERVISLLAKFMVNQGLEVEILMISTNKIQSFYELDDKVKLSLLINEGAQVPKTFKRVRLIKKHLKKYRPDYVISFTARECICTFCNKKFKCKAHSIRA